MDGGPAISSMNGLFGIGPLLYINEPRLINNINTWANKANLLFIDNPAGVGYSFAAT
jgi:carboxypeptidase C (cathepsin A)